MEVSRLRLMALAAGGIIFALTGWKSAPLVYETAKAVDVSDWPEQLQVAIRHAARADCSGAWSALWPLARKRDPDALSIIADLSLEGLYLPDFKDPAHDQLSLLIYASTTLGNYHLRKNSGPSAWRERGAELVSYRSQKPGALDVVTCLRSSEAAFECEKLAVKHGIIRPFPKFTTEMTKRVEKRSDVIGCVDELRVKG